MTWDEPSPGSGRHTLKAWGKPPARIEPVKGTIVLRHLDGAVQSVTAQPLDGDGRALGATIPALKTDTGWQLPLGTPPTTWYVITVGRN